MACTRKSCGGFILSVESLIFVALLVIGLIVGWVTIRDAANAELIDISNAIEGSIGYHYFADPDRGAGLPFEPDSLEYLAPSADEGGVSLSDLALLPASATGSTNTPELPPSPTGRTASAE